METISPKSGKPIAVSATARPHFHWIFGHLGQQEAAVHTIVKARFSPIDSTHTN